ncbi:MAG TPA: radical SAM protein [Candidatus Desulfofervidus auxilii]|uniref:Radical SAM protein n=1 Tax=Desulfofervidus auxilii TaxID=1621989 RepID=A0A7C1VTN7_DESA2|nr:radical SAM protein [Candidatus Desulfofervidus auxilii]
MKLAFQILNSKKNNFLLKKPLPIKLTLALTFLCNSQCKTCNIWKIYKNNPDKYKEELNAENWKQLFDETGDSLGWVEFTGGEPLLKKDIVDIVSYTYNNTFIFAGGITTNAVSPKNSYKKINVILEKIPDNKILNVGISLDGAPKLHDEIRGIKGNFEKAIYLFNELKELKQQYEILNIHFAYTISQYNAGRFEEFYNFVKNDYGISIDEITITFEHFTSYYARENNKLNNPYKQFKKSIEKDVVFYINVLKKKNKKIYLIR